MTRQSREAMSNTQIAIIVAIFTALTLSSYVLTSSVLAQGPPTIPVNLTGKEEVPPVETKATGVAEFKQVGTEYRAYSVKATNIQGATAGHIHLGAKGENGPVVFTLFKYDTPKNQVLETGTITDDKLEGPMAGKLLSDLASAGVNDMLYINIHTEKNPNGEIRGQIGSPITP
jgi:CHRD domain